MNMISKLRQRVRKDRTAEISIDEFNQLQAEWITRTKMEKDELTASPVEQLVSQPIQCGKDYKQFCLLREQIRKGYKPIIYGDNYVVMDRKTFDGLKKLTEKVD